MPPDDVGARLRPRRPWEGADLGFALGREAFLPLWLLWWTTALPIASVALILTGGRADLWLAILWWCKPLYEAPLQYWASRAMLGERPAPRDVPHILRATLTLRILPWLSWRRLGLRRSYRMPVTLVEGLTGEPARRRRAILDQGSAVPIWLTLVCYHFEAILWAGLVLTLLFGLVEGLPRLDPASALIRADSPADWISSLASVLVFSVIAPFYVCGGFALYLTRRIELEAWDLEIAFRRARAEQRTSRVETSRILAAALILFAFAPAASPVSADPAALPTPAEGRRIIEEVLADEVFGRTREVTLWLPAARESEDPAAQRWSAAWVELFLLIAELLKWVLLVCAIAAATAIALHRLRERLRVGRSEQPPPPRRTPVRIGRPGPRAVPASAPEPLESVRRLVETGRQRIALALLYRASIAAVERCGTHVPAGATEPECLMLAQAVLTTPQLEVLQRLLAHWGRLAYAHRSAPDASLLALAEDWAAAGFTE